MENITVSPVPCPAPFNTTLDAATPQVVNSDFNAAQLANYQGALNYTGNNKAYAHTFIWKPNTCCCVITSATLTVKLKALEGGVSTTSSDCGNDLISIVGFGGIGLITSERVYSSVIPPFPVNTIVTKTFTIQGSALNKLNTEHTLSFFVENDSSVLSATLQLSGCCLSK